MRVLILGIDGYLGWSLAQYLAERGHDIGGIDNLSRRGLVESAIPIQPVHDRYEALDSVYGSQIEYSHININEKTDYKMLCYFMENFKPDTIVHLAENPSAPHSMKGVEESCEVQENNVIGTLRVLWAMRECCPDAHLLKLGSMGEYGVPGIRIPEGFFEIDGQLLPFPKQPGSFYHLSKVHDSQNIMFACKMWDLKSTDIMQGVVYGTRVAKMAEDPRLRTRLDFDECFGTAINRFVCQAIIGYPLTLYGEGHQKRGFLTLEDSMQCLTLAVENPPEKGEYRVFNQLEEVYDLTELAEVVKIAASEFGIEATISNLTNPRKEAEDHFYEVDHEKLPKLGFKPVRTILEELDIMFDDLIPFKDRIEERKDLIKPKTLWS